MKEENEHIIQQLDKSSFELLFRNNFKGLTHFAQKYVKDFETAKEIVQEAFINLWEKRENIDLSKPVKSYLTTIVYNRSLNFLRDNKKFDRDILNFENLYPQQYYDSADKMVTSEITKSINNAIEGLPEKCREIFVLNRFENLKYKEIADKLNISVKTVEAQMSKALQYMREKLAEYLTIILIMLEILLNKK